MHSQLVFSVSSLSSQLAGLIPFSVLAGGMFFWLRLPEGVSSQQVLKEALQEKVLVLPGTPFFPCKSDLDDAFLRLSFACLSPEQINTAIEILAKVIKRLI